MAEHEKTISEWEAKVAALELALKKSERDGQALREKVAQLTEELADISNSLQDNQV